jgi:hypothetical protein
VAGNLLTITVNLTREVGSASSAKTIIIIIASTEGNVAGTERDEKIELNDYRKK